MTPIPPDHWSNGRSRGAASPSPSGPGAGASATTTRSKGRARRRANKDRPRGRRARIRPIWRRRRLIKMIHHLHHPSNGRLLLLANDGTSNLHDHHLDRNYPNEHWCWTASRAHHPRRRRTPGPTRRRRLLCIVMKVTTRRSHPPKAGNITAKIGTTTPKPTGSPQ